MAPGLRDLALPEAPSGPRELTPCRGEGERGGRAPALGQQLLHPTPRVGACVKGSGTFRMVTPNTVPMSSRKPAVPLPPDRQQWAQGQSESEPREGREARRDPLYQDWGPASPPASRILPHMCGERPGACGCSSEWGRAGPGWGGAHPDEVGGDAPPGCSCQLLRGHVL